jgi:hypothetical protein
MQLLKVQNDNPEKRKAEAESFDDGGCHQIPGALQNMAEMGTGNQKNPCICIQTFAGDRIKYLLKGNQYGIIRSERKSTGNAFGIFKKYIIGFTISWTLWIKNHGTV